jgi:phenylpropionate dioxygenase-like ring-hydroxylating dioxygenase large terminal subunit
MIPNMWYAILESNQIKQNNKPHPFKRMGKELVFWRDQQGKLAVLLDRCPHRSAKLSPGKIVDDNIQCRFHGFQYNTHGEIQVIPANGRNGPKPAIFQCQPFVVQEAHGLVWFWNVPGD